MRMQRLWLAFLAFVGVMAFGGVALGAPVGVVAPTTFNFNNQHIGTTPNPTTTFTVTNTQAQSMANDALVVTAIVESGAGCGQFSASPTSFTVNGGGALFQTVTVTYVPTTLTTVSCTFTLTHNQTGVDHTFVATGTGISPVMTVGNSGLSLGSAHVFVTSATTRTVTITNTSAANEDLAWAGSFTSGNTGDFSVTGTGCVANVCSGTLTPNSNTQLTVSFTPQVRGSRGATFTVTGDDSANPSVGTSFTGTGTSPIMTTVPASPFTLDFATVQSGSSLLQTFTIVNANSNPGNETLSFSIAKSGSLDFSFTCTPACGGGNGTVTAGSFATVNVTYAPLARGSDSGSLVITGNDTVTPSATVTLAGNSTLPNLTVTAVGGGVLPDPVLCGTVAVNGGSSTCSFQINNPAPADEPLDYTVNSSNGAVFSVSPASGQVAVDGSTTITVTFNPIAGGSIAAVITVGGDGSGNESVNVTGTGTVPTIQSIVPAGLTVTLASTDITVGPATTSTPSTISLQNAAGGAPLQITSVALTGGQSAQFAIATGSTGSHALAAGSTDTWTVTCTPVAPAGLKTTTFRVTHDSPGGVPGQQLNFTLNCTGLQASVVVGGVLSAWPSAFSILAGTTGNDSVTITNNGNRAISVNSLVSGSSVFVPSIAGGLPALIASGGGSVTLDVAFTPINGATTNTNITVGFDSTAVTPTSLSIPVGGDGIVEGFDISITGEADPGMVALGDRRVLTTVARAVTMQNSSDVPINISAVSSNDSECALASFSQGIPANNVPAGGLVTFNINVTPDHIGAGTCTISMAGLIPSTSTNLAEMIVVTWNGVAPELTLLAPTAGAALDYAGVDIDAAPVQLPVQLQNSGGFLLTITGCSISGPQAARFSVGSCTTTVAAGGDQIFMVTYDPTVEALDGAVLTLNTDSFPVGTVTVDLEGVGLDQHINLPALSYAFPDTFRNPDDAPTQLIVVEDPLDATTGQAAPLTITMAMTEASVDDVFVLPMAGPFTVDPGADIDIPVEFRPTAYATFSGVITIFNDTTGNPMAEVQVTGNGISRNVTVSPGDIDLGLTGVNIPIRLSDVQEGGIEISNIDPDDRAYTVRSLALVDADGNVLDPADTPFSLDAEPNLALSADGTLSYDAEFAPTEEGEYEVTVAIFLDNDPDAHALVTLHGTAVEVELRGGGCQASGSSSTGGLVVMALGLLALPWRRRKAALLAAAVVLALAGIASADPTRNVDLTTFSPAPATEVGTFSVESAEVGVDGAWALDLMFSHATNVLMVTSPSAAAAGMEADTPVSARSSVQLGFAYAFLNRFEAGLRVPVHQQTGTMPQFSGLAPADGTALGDVAAHGKVNLLSSDSIALGASLDVTVPTATDGEFAGVDGPTGQLRALIGWRAHRFGVNVNAGFLGRGTSELGNIEQGSALTFGGGAWFRALDAMYVIGETFGSAGMGNGVKQAEGVLGVRYEVARSVGVSVGAGRGIIHGVGSPDVRGFLLVDVAPKARESAPLKIIIPPPPRDTRDDDGDGVVNADDKCAEAEDMDEFQDDDGCPEVDNDEDGIPDSEDKCALEAEDPDGHLDEDGCIDGDNDGDGILDLDDKCPGEAEDKDGYMDSDGCDEVDNDSDGIPDVIDQCALEQETINGNNDDDGCPDNGDSLVMVMPDRIEIFEPVVFTGTSSTLSKKSANILGQVAATMRANRDFKRLRVTVHVHPRDNNDQALSDKRAKVVRDWLVQWGIEPERVEARGLGSTRPLVPKKNKGAAALNDRVEFIILEKEDVTPATNQP